MTTADYLATATALQRHESLVLRRYRAHMAELLRADADDYERRALEADPADRKELEWMAFGIRIAAAKVEP